MRRTWRRPLLSLTVWGMAAVTGYFGFHFAQNQQFARAEEQRDDLRRGLAQVDNLSTVFRHVGQLLEDSVVNISVRKKGPAFHQMPFDEDMLRKMFPDRDGDGEPDVPDGMKPNKEEAPFDAPETMGTGSGVIMEYADGHAYIVTNNHVAGGAEEIVITLNNGREIHNGKVLGADAKTDLAVVRIDVDKLPVATWGNSDELQKGDWVMAFGSPFGYVGSMTHGIVSALNRTNVGILGTGGYEDFIQVDAPINPGNSGGPLVNVKGEVVGINTAIASRSGGFQGIGFAIPSNQAKFIYTSLKEKGKVIRGWLGVSIGDVSKNMPMAETFGWTKSTGVLVQQVIPGTPASDKLEHGDIITEVNGKSVESMQQLRSAIAAIPPASDVALTVFRDNKTQKVTIKLGEQPEDLAMVRPAKEPGPGDTTPATEALGIRVQTLTGELAEKYGVDVKVGAVITRVDRNSVAAREQLRPGDVITEVGNKSIKSADEFMTAMKSADLKKGIRLYVMTREGARFVLLSSEK